MIRKIIPSFLTILFFIWILTLVDFLNDADTTTTISELFWLFWLVLALVFLFLLVGLLVLLLNNTPIDINTADDRDSSADKVNAWINNTFLLRLFVFFVIGVVFFILFSLKLESASISWSAVFVPIYVWLGLVFVVMLMDLFFPRWTGLLCFRWCYSTKRDNPLSYKDNTPMDFGSPKSKVVEGDLVYTFTTGTSSMAEKELIGSRFNGTERHKIPAFYGFTWLAHAPFPTSIPDLSLMRLVYNKKRSVLYIIWGLFFFFSVCLFVSLIFLNICLIEVDNVGTVALADRWGGVFIPLIVASILWLFKIITLLAVYRMRLLDGNDYKIEKSLVSIIAVKDLVGLLVFTGTYALVWERLVRADIARNDWDLTFTPLLVGVIVFFFVQLFQLVWICANRHEDNGHDDLAFPYLTGFCWGDEHKAKRRKENTEFM